MKDLQDDLVSIVAVQAGQLERLERDKSELFELLDLALDGDLDSRWEYYSSSTETVREHIKSELAKHKNEVKK